MVFRVFILGGRWLARRKGVRSGLPVLGPLLLFFLLTDALAIDEEPCFLQRLAEDFKYLATSPSRLDATSAVITLGLVGIGGVLYAQDEEIRDFALKHKTSFLDDLAVAGQAIGYPYCVGLAGLWGGTGYLIKNEKMKTTSLLSLESFVVANTVSISFKFATGRARPKRDRGSASYKPFSFDMSDTAFPSGHATAAFSIASVFADQYERDWADVLAYGLACLSAFERINDDKHWASDVFAGAVLGTVVGKSVVYLHGQRDRSVYLFPVAESSTGTLGLLVHVKF
jgi:membrane-associated phospholipid phosphatase